MNKYQTLVNILDHLLDEAPPQYISYHPALTDIEAVDQARSKAFIHLFLKVQFGLLTFEEREKYITDGPQDGGIDAYYIDTDRRLIYFIQSKFRTSKNNFEEKDMLVEDLLKMDVDNITKGFPNNAQGIPYNGKIQGMIRAIQNISDIARYDYKVIILANLKAVIRKNLDRIITGYVHEVFDFTKCYNDLVFPTVSGTYYNASDLFININLSPHEYTAPRIRYHVRTECAECEISALFVPTLEIAKVMYKYKNSVLKYNPRSYLTLSWNKVNHEIANTITNLTTNEFSLFNNGITMLSDDTRFTERTGRESIGQLLVKNPQIVNGGQTAYTLSQLYEMALKGELQEDVFKGKEVMLKVITFVEGEMPDEADKLRLIEQISRATNQQSPVREPDRRSNDKIQLELQNMLFREFGYFYERKEGEFFDGLTRHYITQDQVVKRELLLRIAYAIAGQPERARGVNVTVLFSPENIETVLNDQTDFSRLFFGYYCFLQLEELQRAYRGSRNNPFGILNYGNALRFGKYAVICVMDSRLVEVVEPGNLHELSERYLPAILKQWPHFEEYIRKQRLNKQYFPTVIDPITMEERIEPDWGGYYKGRTVSHDLAQYFNLS